MKNFAAVTLILVSVLLAGCDVVSEPPDIQNLRETRPIGSAKEFDVDLKFDVGQLEITKAQDEDLKGKYSNLMQITHTQEEFVLDFFLVIPPQGTLASRVILSPGHLKRMIKALEDNIEKYEVKFGKIQEAESPETPLGFNPQ